MRLFRLVVLAAVTAAATLTLVAPGSARALLHAVDPPPAQPTSADQIQNIDQVRTAIKAYYGDTVTQEMDPVDGTKALHTFSATGAYANEMADLEADAAKYLDHAAKKAVKNPDTRAILFDVDDTTLNTFNYEIYSNFAFNPTTNAAFVNAAAFPAVPGMVNLEHYAEAKGFTVFFLTGRPVGQHDGTVANLTNVGYDVVDGNLYLKDQTRPWLSSCAPTCTTTQYKSLTRQHIESLGYDIAANFGDQFSDLNGGFADEAFKVPNPMYFLP